MYIHDSYIEAGQQLPRRDRERYYTALVEFVSFGAEPELSGAANAIFTAIRPAIELSKKRAEAGSKGGKKSAKTRADSNFATKQKASKTETSNEAKREVASAIDTYISISKDNPKGLGGAGGREPDPRTAEAAEEIVGHLNAVLGTRYRPRSKDTLRRISARLREGYTVEDFRTVIDKKAAAWRNNPDMAPYLRPETLFGSKFEAYLNEIDAKGARQGGRYDKYR